MSLKKIVKVNVCALHRTLVAYIKIHNDYVVGSNCFFFFPFFLILCLSFSSPFHLLHFTVLHPFFFWFLILICGCYICWDLLIQCKGRFYAWLWVMMFAPIATLAVPLHSYQWKQFPTTRSTKACSTFLKRLERGWWRWFEG